MFLEAPSGSTERIVVPLVDEKKPVQIFVNKIGAETTDLGREQAPVEYVCRLNRYGTVTPTPSTEHRASTRHDAHVRYTEASELVSKRERVKEKVLGDCGCASKEAATCKPPASH